MYETIEFLINNNIKLVFLNKKIRSVISNALNKIIPKYIEKLLA